jgi:hypothetical protein
MPEPYNFSDYLVFVDESGDHNLARIDPQFPVFVLLFAIVAKDDYVERICPDLQRFKFEFWGHNEAILHEHEIRKPAGDFLFLINADVRNRFLNKLTALMTAMPATLIAVVIDKSKMIEDYRNPANPYEYALEAGLERVFMHLDSLEQTRGNTPIVVETRGKREDAELELAFRRVIDGGNALRRRFPFQLRMTSKLSNSAGLQLTDLMARPVAMHHLRPDQPNRAFEIIKKKLESGPDGEIEGWGLKRLP